MVFIDSNVPMYLVGAEHPRKHDARRLLEAFVRREERLVTDAEVLQEILHRYVALRRHDAIQPAFDALTEVVDEIFPVTSADVSLAKNLVLARSLSARDAVHVAVMQNSGVTRVLSFDTDFDAVPGISRIHR